MSAFLPGRALCERFYAQAVRPLLDQHFPDVPHGAALVGYGSEVLGFDTAVSSDHDWGPRVLLFLDEARHARHAGAIHQMLRERLPHQFLGWPTHFSEPDPGDHTRQLMAHASGPVNHRVELWTWHEFLQGYLGVDPRQPLQPCDWLAFPSQKLRTLTAGPVFHDAVGLAARRGSLAWYPHDVWLYLLAAGWKRISQEEHLMGRAGQAGDELGSALIAARLVRDAMRLCFLMERQYAPYPKWYGSAFAQLKAAPELGPVLAQVLQATGWPQRDRALALAYTRLAEMHNALGLTEPLSAAVQPFHDRPFQVIFGERFTRALQARITDPQVQRIPLQIGGIDQWSDSADLMRSTQLHGRLCALYAPAA